MAPWSVRADADAGGYDETLDTALRTALAAYSPAIGAAHLGGRPVPDRISVQLAIEASTLHQAQDEARRELAAALRDAGRRGAVVRMETMTWGDFEAELEADPPEILGIQEIATILTVSRQRAHQIVQRDDFPPPLAKLASGSIWAGAAVRRWATTWERRAGRPPKSASA